MNSSARTEAGPTLGAAIPASRRSASVWPRALMLLAVALAAMVGLHRDTAFAMVAIWDRSDTFAHCWLVLPIVLWLVWRQRAALARLTPQPSAPMLGLLAGAAFAWLLSDLAAVDAGAQFALMAMLVLAVTAVLGTQVARALMFPLAFAFFAVPAGEFTMPTLMSWTADFVVRGLQLSGIPVYREGLQFVIPSGNWSVVEACSGVRYLIASVMVGTLFAYLNYRSLRRRWMFVGVAIVVPVVANWLRAYLIVMLGHLSGNTLAVGADHLIYGWIFFGVVITVMFVIGARWSEAPGDAIDEAVEAPPQPRPSWMMPLVATSAIVVAALPLQALKGIVSAERHDVPRLSAPALPGGWQAVAPFSSFKPAYLSPAAEVQRVFASNGSGVGLYIAYYRHQGRSSKLVNSQNALVQSDNAAWVQVSADATTVRVDGRPLGVRSARLLGKATPGDPASEQRLLAWSFYWVDGRLTASDTWAKIRGAQQRLLGGGDDAAAIVLYTPDTPAAPALLAAFLQENLGAVTAQLAKVRDGD